MLDTSGYVCFRFEPACFAGKHSRAALTKASLERRTRLLRSKALRRGSDTQLGVACFDSYSDRGRSVARRSPSPIRAARERLSAKQAGFRRSEPRASAFQRSKRVRTESRSHAPPESQDPFKEQAAAANPAAPPKARFVRALTGKAGSCQQEYTVGAFLSGGRPSHENETDRPFSPGSFPRS